MKDLQEKEPLIEEIWDLLLSQFDVGASKEVQQSIIKFSLQQARALQFLRTKQQKDAHLQHFIQANAISGGGAAKNKEPRESQGRSQGSLRGWRR
ncbi:Hypothetical predicted protein [Podarcis lilfordi]|uniref:Uncharacterized protein n=1 Tax=Podarcis lilfordi TaxID=74358 RepID=A0AA35JTD6_9SAUR|nr:Hypothetical predicted protein [Podarcis lilfordi]